MESLARAQPQPDRPQDAPPPRSLPRGEKELLVRRGPRVPQGSLGQCPVLSARPSRWLGRRPMGPSLLSNQTPENPEWPLFSSRRKPRVRVAGFPAWDPASGSLQSWSQPNALFFRVAVLPSPCPSDISSPLSRSLPRGFPKERRDPRRQGFKPGNPLAHLFHHPPT